MRVEYQQRYAATDEVIYKNFRDTLSFRIGDVRDYASVCAALRGADIVFNAAALKQVPTCEYFPYEAVQTNITGAGEHRARDPRTCSCRSRRSSASRPTRRASRSTSWA